MNRIGESKLGRLLFPAFVLLVILGSVGCNKHQSLETTTEGDEWNSASIAETPIATDFSWTNDMVWIPSGKFWRGSEFGQGDERPVREISVSGFWIDRYEVTNERYKDFADATGYVTVAERRPDPSMFPGADPSMLVSGSICFLPPPGDNIPLNNHMIWWQYVAGANWRHPDGPDSDTGGRGDHPVVHVCWEDAMKFAEWADKRLPTEAEWEYAARGGKERMEFVWGEEFAPNGKAMANIWHGQFPNQNTLDDGNFGVAPVGGYEPNGYGLYDMAGNVWEWCQDWYFPSYYEDCPNQDPPGPDRSYDPNEPGVWKRVTRGGSFLCTDLYCGGYRPSFRMKSSPDTSLAHTGFRCVRQGPSPEEIARILEGQ